MRDWIRDNWMFILYAVVALMLLTFAGIASGADVSLYVATPADVTEEMLRLADVQRTDTVYDLGCGAARIVVTAAVRYGCRAVGIELDAELCEYARRNCTTNGVEKLVEIRQGDVLEASFRDADVVCLYLMPGLLAKLSPTLKALRPGTRIITHDKAIPGWRPDKTKRVWSETTQRDHMLFLYYVTKPCSGGT